MFLLSDEGAGTLLVQHASGCVDGRVPARLGGHSPGPLREALGIRVEEHWPLRTPPP
ncbi:hypothetical protein [Streptomyces sp. NPDC054787]